MKITGLALLILLLGLWAVYKMNPTVEHASGSPGALIQLATSSVNTLPGYYYPEYNPYYYPYYYDTRPVLQRGVYFGRPSWNRSGLPTKVYYETEKSGYVPEQQNFMFMGLLAILTTAMLFMVFTNQK